MIAAVVIFWLCTFALVHSYLLYPLLVRFLGRNIKETPKRKPSYQDLPEMFILMAVYNEEAVIEQKLQTILNATYPKDKLRIIIGSDKSTDATDTIIQAYADKDPRIDLQRFESRTGKIGIINQLYKNVGPLPGSILVMTDANAMFEEDLLLQLAMPFDDSKVGLVAANILNSGVREDGISHHEKTYIQGENRTKYLEGELWGCMMGAFGACYAMRAELYRPVPAGFKVDDFYISMKVLEQGFKAIKSVDAICYEDVSNEITEEFRRKVRISSGNFQNLAVFYKMLWPGRGAVSFAFLSHKVLRWLGPYFMLGAFFSALYLSQVNVFYAVAFILQNMLLLILPIEWLCRRSGVHFIPLRFVTYFYYMNLALLAGSIKYIKGDRQNVWEPTKRNH